LLQSVDVSNIEDTTAQIQTAVVRAGLRQQIVQDKGVVYNVLQKILQTMTKAELIN